MILIEKKANAVNHKDFRAICFICHVSKSMLKVLQKCIETKVEAINHLGEDQFGFWRGRSTRDAIGVMMVIGERNIERGKDVYACFVDYEKAI